MFSVDNHRRSYLNDFSVDLAVNSSSVGCLLRRGISAFVSKRIEEGSSSLFMRNRSTTAYSIDNLKLEAMKWKCSFC